MQWHLNGFQKSMLQWNDLHPYNAVHVVRIPAAFDGVRLNSAITGVLERNRLTGLVLNRKAGVFQFEGGLPPLVIHTVDAQVSSTPGFGPEIERQLNTPFSQDGPVSPFRFFVVPEVDAFSLGLAYFHPVADAESILILVKEMVNTYRGALDIRPSDRVECFPPARPFPLRQRAGLLLSRMATLPRMVKKVRRASRPHYRDAEDLANKYAFFSLKKETLQEMVQAAKSLGVTLNDLFLALTMKGVSPSTSNKRCQSRRPGISLGCIVNIRRDLGLQSGRAFGVFLGSFVVQHDVPPGIDLADLARDIGIQTRKIKRSRLYLGADLELAFERLMTSFFSEQRRRRLYQKHYPLWGGLTNMDLNPLWPQPKEMRPVEYFRAVSTGPVTPLVLSISTIGQVANVGLTYRPAVFAPSDIDRIQECFVNSLKFLRDEVQCAS